MYRARPKVCGACPMKIHCCPMAAARTLLRPDDGGLRDRVVTFLRTPAARRTRQRRSVWVETANAELKERHGLRRARGRGRDAVLIQALGAAIAYNVKKLAAGWSAGQATDMAAATPSATATHRSLAAARGGAVGHPVYPCRRGSPPSTTRIGRQVPTGHPVRAPFGRSGRPTSRGAKDRQGPATRVWQQAHWKHLERPGLGVELDEAKLQRYRVG